MSKWLMAAVHCEYCGRELDDGKPASRRTKEHIIPRVFRTNPGRLAIVAACAGCNHTRGSLTPAELRARAKALRHHGDLLEAMADRIDELVEERGLLAPWSER